MYALYSLLFFLALIVSTPWWLLQIWRHGKYRTGWRERLGRVPERLLRDPAPDVIWIHAVSVGEVLAMTQIIDALKQQLPGWRIVVSTTTDTGQKLARQRFGEMALGYIRCDGQCIGEPALRAGVVVKIEGVGERFSGLYYVTSTEQRFSPKKGYRTRFAARRNAT